MSCNEERIYEEAQYIIAHGATVRETARALQASKSTVHKDVTTRLSCLNPRLAADVREVLDVNKAERHLRGGAATMALYKGRHRTKAKS